MNKTINIWSLVSVTVMAVFMAIFYQVAWQYPVVDSFPLIERIINPQFLPMDFYTNTFAEYSPRKNIAELIAKGAQFLGVEPEHFVAWANILRIMAFALAMYWFYRGALKESHANAPTVAFIAFYLSAISFLGMPVQPAWWPVTQDFTASSLAGAFAMAGWALVMFKQVGLTLAVLGVAAFYHPLVGAHGLIIAVILYSAKYGINALWPLFKRPTVYLGSAVFSAAFLSAYLPYQKTLDDQTFIAINAVYKHGHHFLFSHMPLGKWVGLGLAMLVLGYMLWRHKKNGTEEPLVVPVAVYSAVMIAIGWLFVEVFPSRTAVSFIPMRAFPILVPVFILCYARWAFRFYQNRDYLSFLVLHLPFLPYGQLGITWFVFPDQPSHILPLLVFVGSFIFVMARELWFEPDGAVNRWLHPRLTRFSWQQNMTPVFLICLMYGLLTFKINVPTLETQPALYHWLTDNTDKNDVIVAELNAANNQKLRLLSERAVVVSKDFPFSEKFYEQWYQRYRDVYHYQPRARGRIDKLSENELNGIMDKYRATVLIRTVPLVNPVHFKEIGSTKGEKRQAIVYRNLELE